MITHWWQYLLPFIGLPVSMIGMHFVCDFPLQGNYLSSMKDPKRLNAKPQWWIFMTAHCSIQAFGVYLFTGGNSFVPAFAEFIAHFIIDYFKAKRKVTFLEDQIAHIFCKLVWCLYLAGWRWMWRLHV